MAIIHYAGIFRWKIPSLFTILVPNQFFGSVSRNETIAEHVVKHTQEKSELQNFHLNILRIVTFKLHLSEWTKLGK